MQVLGKLKMALFNQQYFSGEQIKIVISEKINECHNSKAMNKEKHNNYFLYGSFHTLGIKSQEITPTKVKIVSNCITARIN